MEIARVRPGSRATFAETKWPRRTGPKPCEILND
jgi:hypothetical protein